MVVAKTPLAHPVPPPSPASPFQTPRYKEVVAFFTEMAAGDRPVRRATFTRGASASSLTNAGSLARCVAVGDVACPSVPSRHARAVLRGTTCCVIGAARETDLT